MTLEAWVRPTALGNAWRTALMKEAPGISSYALYAAGTDGTKVPEAEFFSGGFRTTGATASLAVNTWTHIATTYDGTALKLFVNGTQASQLLFTGIDHDLDRRASDRRQHVWGEWFQGEIDEVRIYNRARTATEIQADMNTSISAPDTTPPSAPGTLTATGGLGQVGLAWGAATDNVVVARYNVHRSTTPGFTPTAGNRIAQPTGTSYTDAGLAAGTYYYRVTAEDAAGNVGPASNEASAVSSADTTPPTVSITAPPRRDRLRRRHRHRQRDRQRHRRRRPVQARRRQPRRRGHVGAVLGLLGHVHGRKRTAHALRRRPRRSRQHRSGANVPVTVQNTASAGLVGAWAFDEGSGTTASDQSGRGNTGTLANASWTTGGKFNNALSFNGTNAWVTVPDSATLDLTTGMTLEAWVRPTVTGSWRTVVMKEQSGNLVYGLYANTSTNRPRVGDLRGGTLRTLDGPTQLPTATWSHLAATYDGANLRLFVNGAQVSQLATRLDHRLDRSRSASAATASGASSSAA